MPISRQRFDEAPDEWMMHQAAADRVAAFLAARADEAFTEDEVAAALQDEWPAGDFSPQMALLLARTLALVKTNVVGDERYFAAVVRQASGQPLQVP